MHFLVFQKRHVNSSHKSNSRNTKNLRKSSNSNISKLTFEPISVERRTFAGWLETHVIQHYADKIHRGVGAGAKRAQSGNPKRAILSVLFFSPLFFGQGIVVSSNAGALSEREGRREKMGTSRCSDGARRCCCAVLAIIIIAAGELYTRGALRRPLRGSFSIIAAGRVRILPPRFVRPIFVFYFLDAIWSRYIFSPCVIVVAVTWLFEIKSFCRSLTMMLKT